jgi:hypothetical protein
MLKCGTTTTVGPQEGPDVGPLGGPDVGPDVAPDVGPLVGPEVVVGPDLGPLVGPDVGPDVAPDVATVPRNARATSILPGLPFKTGLLPIKLFSSASKAPSIPVTISPRPLAGF